MVCPTAARAEIGAAPEWSSVGRGEHRQRPAPLLAQRGQRGHIDLVDVRAFLSVDLDGNEQSVDQRRGVGVLE